MKYLIPLSLIENALCRIPSSSGQAEEKGRVIITSHLLAQPNFGQPSSHGGELRGLKRNIENWEYSIFSHVSKSIEKSIYSIDAGIRDIALIHSTYVEGRYQYSHCHFAHSVGQGTQSPLPACQLPVNQ